MDLLISGATVLTMDADLRVLPDAFVGITGGKISFLGKAAPVEKPKKIRQAIYKKDKNEDGRGSVFNA